VGQSLRNFFIYRMLTHRDSAGLSARYIYFWPNVAIALQSSAIVIICSLSVCLSSVTFVYCDKTTEAKIT